MDNTQANQPFHEDNLNKSLLDMSNRLDFIIHNIANKDTSINNNEGCAISINAPWGSGKTFFLNYYLEKIKGNNNRITPLVPKKKKGMKDVSIYTMDKATNVEVNDKNKTSPKLLQVVPISFNAWENDYIDPISAIINSISEKYKSKSNELIKSTIALTNYLPDITTAAFISGHPHLGFFMKIINQFKRKFTKTKSKKETINEFKKNLSKLGENSIEDSPTKIIVIDELDRCRPDYSVSLLEICKHFFYTKKLFFIILMDKKNLCATIRKVYGNDFDAEHYLSRFFDIELELPISANFHQDLIAKEIGYKMNAANGLGVAEVYSATSLISNLSLSAREVKKICSNFYHINNLLSGTYDYAYIIIFLSL